MVYGTHRSPAGVVWGMVCAVNAVGCSQAVRPKLTYPIAMAYHVHPHLIDGGPDWVQRLEADLATIESWGFRMVWVRHLGETEADEVAAAAERHRLSLVVADRPSLFYVRTGRMPPGIRGPRRLVRQTGRRPQRPSTVVCLGNVCDDDTADRARVLVEAWRIVAPAVSTMVIAHPETAESACRSEAGMIWVRAAHEADRTLAATAEDRSAPVQVLSAAQSPDGDEDLATRLWLARYHAGLAAGATGGLVIDRYCGVPGVEQGITACGAGVPVARATAIGRLVARARAWGPRLARVRPKTQTTLQPHPPLHATLFTGGRRRYLLFRNDSVERFVHDTVPVPAVLDGVSVRRLVSVPGDADVPLGEVVEVATDRQALRVDLAPGDARLYELF